MSKSKIKIIADFAAYVKRTNKKFEAATKAEKRVIIAKDVIARINAHNITAVTGALIDNIEDDLGKDSFKDFINIASCEACAKGSLFCALVGRVNDVTTFEVNSDSGGNDRKGPIHKKLLEYFSISQLDLIETAFEGESLLSTGIDENAALIFRDNLKVDDGYDGYSIDPDELLIAICTNIIKNKGTFKP